jgi:RHS repeat-associated protein
VTGTPGNWDSGAYTYDGAGNITGIGAQWYVYDGVSRLSGFRWGTDEQCDQGLNEAGYRYDAFGNRTFGWVLCGSSEGQSVEFTDPSTNHLQWATYDAAGNVLNWFSLPGAPVFEYYPGSAVSKACGLNLNELYGYTADGERIATYDAFTGTYRITLRDLGGKVLRLFEVSGVSPHVWTEEQDWVVRGGALLATFEGGVEKHYHLDHLGTPRLVTSAAGTGLEVREYRPFGEGGTINDRMQFTGHERDQSSGLDYLHARYYNPNIARFLSVDPAGGKPASPQRWNRYAYALNNPTRYIDPNGEDAIDFVNGLVNAFGSSMLLGAGRQSPINSDYAGGQAAGDETTRIKVRILPRGIEWKVEASSVSLFAHGAHWMDGFFRAAPTGK